MNSLCDFTTMEKIEYQAAIKNLFLKNKTNAEIEAEYNKVFGNFAPSLSTIKYTAQFKCGRASIFYERSGRPNEVTSEMIEKIGK